MCISGANGPMKKGLHTVNNQRIADTVKIILNFWWRAKLLRKHLVKCIPRGD